MSTAKRSRRQHLEAQSASPPSAPLPASKRLKIEKATPTRKPQRQSALGFLVDEEVRAGKPLEAKLTNGVPSARTSRVDESHALVATQAQEHRSVTSAVGESHDTAIDISSAEESSSEDDDEDDDGDQASPVDGWAGEESQHKNALPNGHPLPNGRHDADAENTEMADDAMVNGEEEEQAIGEPEEPSFGDLLQTRHPETIDVSSFPNPMADRQALIPFSSDTQTVAIPTGTSLVTALTQALRTNDKEALERCFHERDLPTIRATLQRLPSPQVGILLRRLAERIHKRPGRTGTLLVWVQWALVAHGGYIASQPEILRDLRPLAQVMRERASGLHSLLQLKGKLDMLRSQLDLRRELQAASRAAHEEEEGDEEEGVVFVEGQTAEWGDSEADEGDLSRGIRDRVRMQQKEQIATPESERSESEDESGSEVDGMNGVVQQDESGESGDEEDEGLLDIEAEETDDDDADEDEDEEGSESELDADLEDDEDTDEDDEEESVPVKQAAPQKLNRKR